MKRVILMLIICLMLPFACAREESVEKPTLTEEQQELWVERGVLPVSTIQEASRLAGYHVATPGFLPVDYLVGCFQLSQLGMPPQLGGEWGQGKIVVDRQWTWPGETIWPGEGRLFLSQFQGTEESVNGEPFEVCGRPGKREFHEEGREHPLLVLHWWEGNMVYSLGGLLEGPLTEEVLLKIACSVH